MTSPLAHLPDEKLLAQLKFVRRIALNLLLLDEDAGEDLAQDTILVSLEKSPREENNRLAWILGISRRLSLYKERSDQRRKKRELARAVSDQAPSAEAVAEQAEICEFIARFTNELDEPFRTAIVLRFYDDLSKDRIARMTGVTIRTVDRRLRDGLAMIRKRLDKKVGDRHTWQYFLAPLLSGEAVQPPMMMILKFTVVAALVVPAAIVVTSLLVSQNRKIKAPLGGIETTKSEEAKTPSSRPIVATKNPLAQPDQEPTPTAKMVETPKVDRPEKTITPAPMPSAFTISGQVLGPWGAPMDGIYVQAVRGKEKRHVLTNQDGRFQIPDLKLGKHVLEVRTVVEQSATGWSKYWYEGGAVLARQEGIQAGARVVALRIVYGASAAGIFFDQRTGKPVDIPVFPQTGKGKRGYTEYFPGLKSQGGQFVMLFKKPRPVRLAFNPVGCNFLKCAWQKIQLESGPMRGLMFKFGPGGVIYGVVRHESRKAMKGIRISVYDRKTKALVGMVVGPKEAVKEIPFRLKGLKAGAFNLHIYPIGYPAFRICGIAVVAGIETHRDIIIREGGELLLEVKNPNGKPVAFRAEIQNAKTNKLAIAAHRENEELQFRKERQSGERILLPPGTFKITVTTRNKKQDRVFSIDSGKTTEVSIAVE